MFYAYKFSLAIAIGAVLVTVLSSCQTTKIFKKPIKASASIEQDFKQARLAMNSGKTKIALAKFKKIYSGSPNSDLANDAHMLTAQIFENQQLWTDALQHYLAVGHSEYETPFESEALLRAAKIHSRFNRFSEAKSLVSEITKSQNATPTQKIAAAELAGEIALAENDVLAALEIYVNLYDNAQEAALKDRYRIAAQDLLDTRLSEDLISDVADSSRFGFLRPIAMFRVGLIYADQKNLSRARSMFQDVVGLAPGTELAERASILVSQIDARSRVNPMTIGAILPLSGRQQVMGYRALRGLQLGLGIYSANNKSSGFRLAVIDSEGNPDIARRAVERLVIEDNVIAIVGGLLSRTGGSETSKAQEFGVPTIVLGQKANLTSAGDFIFRNALTSEMQANALAETAVVKLGLKRFGILFPNDPYGTEFASFFWDAIRLRGGVVNAAQPYDPKETDFRNHVQRMVNNYYLEDRADEFRIRYRQFVEKNPRRSSRQGPPKAEDILPPIIDFDAIFIPDSARAAGQIAPMLAYNDVNDVRLIGTNLWNNSSFIDRGQKFIENAILVDGIYTGDRSFSGSNFVKTYNMVFGEMPGMIESQAFDTGLLLRQTISSGASNRIDLRERLAKIKDFPGAFGAMDMSPNRELSRPISVLTVKDGRLMPLDVPAQ